EELALDAPRLAEDLLPFGARIDPRFELRQVERTVADVHGSIADRRHDAPAVAIGLIQKLFRIAGNGERADPVEERRRFPLFELIAVQGRWRRSAASRFGVEEDAGRAGLQRRVVAAGHVDRQDPLPDAIDVDTNRISLARLGG